VRFIKVPDAPESTQVVALGGQEYTLRLTYNTADKHWRLDIQDLDGNTILSGLKVMPNQNLTWRYSHIDGMPEDDICCLRQKNNFDDVGRDNLGDDKTYTLAYMTRDEYLALELSL
jgi:hypothetical protein